MTLSPRSRLPLYMIALAPCDNRLPRPTASSILPVDGAVLGGERTSNESSIALSLEVDDILDIVPIVILPIFEKEVPLSAGIEREGWRLCPMKVVGFGALLEKREEYSVIEFERFLLPVSSFMTTLKRRISEGRRRGSSLVYVWVED